MNRTAQNRLEELLALTTGMAARQLSPHEIEHIWPEEHLILFRTTDGRTGNVEIYVNWNIDQKSHVWKKGRNS